MKANRLFALALILGFVAAAAWAENRSLHWRALEVVAHLDAEGRLHVWERHAMVFDGAWNGGERRFRVLGAQRLTFERISRVDRGGVSHPLRPGDLSRVDDYGWVGEHILRWRSRLPADPPFSNAERVYDIEYVLSGILRRTADGFVLDHDFAFPDRPGPIQSFLLRLTVDPVWKMDRVVPAALARQNLPPGQSFLLTLRLRYDGTGQPVLAGADTTARGDVPAVIAARDVPAWRYLLFVMLIGFSVWCGLRSWRHEKRHGRFEPLTPAKHIDRNWLERHVFAHAPEVVGAAWDAKTDAAEVAAVLARMALEGKIRSEVKESGYWFWRRRTLHLELLCDRRALAGYERQLVAKLFFDGDTTDTARLRKRYRKTGFNPSGVIRAGVRSKVDRLLKRSRGRSWRDGRLTVGLFLAAAVMLAPAIWLDVYNRLIAATLPAAALFVFVYARMSAYAYKQRVYQHHFYASAACLFVLVLAGLTAWSLTVNPLELGPWLQTGFTFLAAAMIYSIFNGLRTDDPPEATLTRKRFAAARRYFEMELKAETPRLDDAWFPYLLALGLGPQVDRWFRDYGISYESLRTTGSTTQSASGASWSGGGGTFGGAGASASWAAAAASMAAGVAEPSSAGGGGGGSSGGGGGGGW